jgi:signal transduction histidine kinase
VTESRALRVLIVDDEVAQMNALCNALRDEGYATTGFSDADRALAALKNDGCDLLLTDLRMPQMDGIELVRAALGVDPSIAAIVMTGHGTIDNAIEAMKAGAIDYILKPFNLTRIRPILARAGTVRKMRLLNAELEQSVRERTLELEAANKELEAFVHSVSHDLQAPVRAIGGYSQLLLKEVAPRLSQRELLLLEHVAGSAKQLAELIDGLLQFARAGRHSLAKVRIDLGTLVAEVLESIRHQYPERQVEVRVASLPDCDADPTLLRQVLTNLLSNAVKFTAKQPGALIEVGAEQRGGESVYFVRDNGIGFDMAHAHKLFRVFERLHDAADYQGTGVGLSIVQRIVERHGGRIWADAAPGKGATFYFTLG